MSDRRQDAARPGRRGFLTLLGLAAAGGTAYATSDTWLPPARDALGELSDGIEGIDPPQPPRRESPTPVPYDDLTRYESLAGSTLYYEASESPSAFWMQEPFATRLEACLTSHWHATGWGVPGQLWSYGTWIDLDTRPRPSWHHAGRAFDLTQVRTTGGDVLASCRYDVWGSASGAERAQHERDYWRLAASLHRDFAHVLTYLYDDAHADHIHVDDSRSDEDGSTFRRGSRIQVQAVQAMCRHVWGADVPDTGTWDEPTRSATSGVLDRIGAGGALTRGDGWRTFLDATARRSA